MKVLDTLQELLIKLRLFDSNSKDLSLTSVLFMVAIGRLALFPADVYSVGILTLAIAHSNAKRFSAHKRTIEDNKQASATATVTSEFETLKTEVLKLVQANNISKLGR